VSCLGADEAVAGGLPSPSGAGAAADAGAAAAIACTRALERLVPRCALGLLLGELAKGRLMSNVSAAFLSTSTDLRRAVVALLVALHGATASTGAFARYTEAHLSLPQQKLLAIYIDKASSGARVASS
jgi:hypothetical protein